MDSKIVVPVITSLLLMLAAGCTSTSKKEQTTLASSQDTSKKTVIQLIVGSTRQGRTSTKLAQLLYDSMSSRSDVTTEVVDIKEYALPFFNDEIAPAKREVINDPAVASWSKKIASADAYIIVVPEYNAGYPGVLKNALDSLYTEWNNKPVAFVAYSGGPSGGASASTQLRSVAQALKMKPVYSDITIPYSWKAFDSKGVLLDTTIVPRVQAVVDKMIKHLHAT